jgi:septum formation topological specificity factor MinE
MAVFRRYTTIDEDDVTVAQRQMDTSMDTQQMKPLEESL